MKKGATTWLWVIIVGLIIAAIIVLGLLRLEFDLATALIQIFSGK